MTLITVDLPAPRELRRGWAALAALRVAEGHDKVVYASGNDWFFDDGGGNWVCLRLVDGGRAVMFGNDHEYSDTYFREAAEYFGEEETDLLAEAPAWWGENIAHTYGEWTGFIYGWDGERWQRAAYELSDGFTSVGLLRASTLDHEDSGLRHTATHAPGLDGRPADEVALDALVAADGDVTAAQVEAVYPGGDSELAAAAARRFLVAPLG